MTKPASKPDLLTSTGLALEVVSASASGADAFKAPEWVQIMPRGKVTCRDGRTFKFEPDRLVERFEAEGIDIPIDLDHGISNGTSPDAVGWIKELQARAEGLFARVEWLESGVEVLRARTRRFLSPTFHHTEEGVTTWLHSVALVAAPALSMAALAHADPTSQQQQDISMKGIAEALGLNPEADEAACLSAFNTFKSGTVAKAVHEETLAKLEATTSELNGLKKAQHDKAVSEVLEAALAAKKITPAQKDSYAALCATDEGFEQVKALLKATADGLAHSGLDEQKAPATDGDALDPAALSAKASAYQAEQASKGITVDIIAAVNHVKETGT
ncbi:putative prophage MuSo2 protein [Roseibium sp. TrichSKD4]|uniref:phage protease n=1 Tax=Roseibium sp. TrichSKD4 TaxID=744980 RepID=UPI0001E57070|nr:phage protease [Roseibium sp. TrichSKD4]EFO31669.1 putative prophage MuSo2 protein [Roseibium sp. TrichSKD4]